MTSSTTDLFLKVVKDLPDRLHLFLQHQHSRSLVSQIPNKQPKIFMSLPIRIDLLRLPGNKHLFSVELKQSYHFTREEIYKITTRAREKNLSLKYKLLQLLKRLVQEHELMQEITWQVRRRHGRNAKVKIEVKLWKRVRREKRTDNHAV